eukprot:GSChrysophyteH1.ASY1.ANO1.1309.1 assembled CDS
MSGFSDANAFLNSPEAIAQYCSNPSTERGQSAQMSCHPTKPIIVYPSGRLVVFRDLENSGNSFIYRGHLFDATVAKFSPNGAYVASADKSGKVRVWAWTNPQKIIKMETQLFSGGVSDLDWSPDNNKITAVGDNGTGLSMKTFTYDTGNSLGEMVGHNKRVTTCSYRPVRPFKVFTGSEDMKTAFFAGPPFKLDHTNNTHSNFVNCVRFSPDGSNIVSVGSDKKLQMYDGVSGEPTQCIENAHAGTIYSVAFSADSSQLLTVSADKTAKLWDVASLTAVKTFTFTGSPSESVAQVADMQVSATFCKAYLGGKFVTLSLNGNLNILDTDAGSSTAISCHQGVGVSASFYSPTTNTIFTADTNGCVCMRDLSSGTADAVKADTTNKRSITNSVHTGAVSGIAVVDDSLIISCGWDDVVRFGSIDGSRITYSDSDNIALPSQPRAMSTPSADGLIAVLTKDKVVFVDAQKKSSCGISAYSGFEGKSITINSTASQIAIGGTDMKTHIFAINTTDSANISMGDALTEIVTRSPVSALAYTAAGDMLAIGDQNQQIEVYSTSNWDTVVKGRWVFHTSQITSLQWSQSGTYLVSGSLDESVYLWNVTDIKFKRQLKFAHRGGVTYVAFSSASNAAGDGAPEFGVISTGADAATVVWKVPKE